MNVSIKAIENGMLVLESQPDCPEEVRQIIRWPLSRLPASLTIGDQLSIRLEAGNRDSSPPLEFNLSVSDSDNEETQRQKMLEQLIN